VSATACPGRNVIDVLERLNDQAIYPLTPALDLPPTLRRGDTGDDVRLLQAAVMPHDGVYSPQTVDAVQVWQARHGLKVDGICGPQTWASILRA
jgi:peptidoglycan hydrolase-like protein with peptidoglycan-binding domain